MKFSIKDFFSKCDQIRSFLRILSQLLKKSLVENFIFCTVIVTKRSILDIAGVLDPPTHLRLVTVISLNLIAIYGRSYLYGNYEIIFC